MITGVGLPSGYQTRLVAWNAAPRAKILCRETAQVSRHSVHPTIDLTVDRRVPVSFRLSLGVRSGVSAIGCIAVRTRPTPEIAALLDLRRAKINFCSRSPVHRTRLSLILVGQRPWVLPTGPDPFGLLHHYRCQPSRTRAIQVVLA